LHFGQSEHITSNINPAPSCAFLVSLENPGVISISGAIGDGQEFMLLVFIFSLFFEMANGGSHSEWHYIARHRR
jgi:hypothetical protein